MLITTTNNVCSSNGNLEDYIETGHATIGKPSLSCGHICLELNGTVYCIREVIIVGLEDYL